MLSAIGGSTSHKVWKVQCGCKHTVSSPVGYECRGNGLHRRALDVSDNELTDEIVKTVFCFLFCFFQTWSHQKAASGAEQV